MMVTASRVHVRPQATLCCGMDSQPSRQPHNQSCSSSKNGIEVLLYCYIVAIERPLPFVQE